MKLGRVSFKLNETWTCTVHHSIFARGLLEHGFDFRAFLSCDVSGGVRVPE